MKNCQAASKQHALTMSLFARGDDGQMRGAPSISSHALSVRSDNLYNKHMESTCKQHYLPHQNYSQLNSVAMTYNNNSTEDRNQDFCSLQQKRRKLEMIPEEFQRTPLDRYMHQNSRSSYDGFRSNDCKENRAVEVKLAEVSSSDPNLTGCVCMDVHCYNIAVNFFLYQ
jgi:hypothetical protein